MKYLIKNSTGRFFKSGDRESWKDKKSEATPYSERDFAEREVANRFPRDVRPTIRIIEVSDWTLKPLGTARPLLRARAAILVATLCDGAETNFALNVSATPQMIDAMCDDLEEAIQAFRDNER